MNVKYECVRVCARPYVNVYVSHVYGRTRIGLCMCVLDPVNNVCKQRTQ